MSVVRIRDEMRVKQLEAFSDAAADLGEIAVSGKLAALKVQGVSPITIFLALAPIIAAFLTGQPVDWKQVLEILMRLQQTNA